MERTEILIGGALLGKGGGERVRGGAGLTGEGLEPLTPQEIDDASRGISGVQDSVIPQDFPTPERLYEENVAPVEPPPTVQPDGKKRPTERAMVEILNHAEKFMGAVRLIEDEWKKRRPAKNYALGGFIPLNTRKWREFYNAIRDLWVPVLVVALGRPGGPILNRWSEFREGGTQRYQVNQEILQMSQLYLDSLRNNSGNTIWQAVEGSTEGRDWNNKSTWPGGSTTWQVARNMAEFWKAIGNPGVRKGLISKLPEGSARTALEQLPERKMTDEEIEKFLEQKGIGPTNAELMRQVVEEFNTGNGDVTDALKAAKDAAGKSSK